MSPNDPHADERTPEQVWDERYGGERVWSGHPNQVLVDEVAELHPGAALDVGCGEGADVLWLAEHGWRATGVDVSGAALARAAEHAERAGLADRVSWRRIDLNTDVLSGVFDLVASSFLHSGAELNRDRILGAFPGLVAPGGTLLLVGHAEPPPWARHGSPAAALPGVDDVLAALHLSDGWTVQRAEIRVRTATGPDGRAAELRDVVVRALRG